MTRMKLLNAALAATLGAGMVAVSDSAQAWFQGPPKYLIVWTSDQYMDGRNVSPLDGILGLPAGALPDADFLAVIDANPVSPTYGHVVNTAEMPAVYGQHLLSATENFVDNALDIALVNSSDPGAPANLAAVGRTVMDDDILGGVPNFNFPGNGLPQVVPAPSSVLNEAHHHSVVPTVQPDGKITAYYGGLISANIFGCDISDPMNIHPAPNSTLENIPLHGSTTQNLCGLTVSGAVHSNLTGTDDLEWNPVSGRYYTTMMGAGGNRGNFGGGTGTVAVSLPPVLTTPGGIQELDPFTGSVIGEYGAVPQASVPGHGKYANGNDMLGPKRYAPRKQVRFGGVDGNGNCAAGDVPTALGFSVFNLCVPGVAPYNQIGADTGAVDLDHGINQGPDTGLLAHPHGIGLRTDLTGTKCDGDGKKCKTTKGGILVTSDYADPVSLALTGSGAGPGTSAQDLGTTVRFWDVGKLSDGPYAVAQMPDGPRHEGNQIHEEPEGLMAMRVTHNHGHKGMFVASMCGGAVFYTPDITVMNPQFKLVYDFGACTGASVFTVTQDDNYIIMPVSGIQRDGDPIHDRDYAGEHNSRMAVLDVRALLSAGNSYKCNAAPASAWNNTGATTPLGQKETLGPSGIVYNNSGDLHNGGTFWPNNGKSDCPKLVDQVDLSGPGEDGVVGTADDHPDSVTSRGGPHFVVHDGFDRYIATSLYFVDLRKYAIADVDVLLSALGLGHAWESLAGHPNSFPPGGPNSGNFPDGGLGAAFQLLDDNNLLPFKTGGWGSVLPGTGSVGDDTVCMMRWNRWTGNLDLDTRFNAGDSTSPTGCLDMDFGDAGKSWPASGTRPTNAGNAEPHGMSFYTVGSFRFFSNGEIGPGTNYTPGLGLSSEQTF
jgi:hypothetical protein